MFERGNINLPGLLLVPGAGDGDAAVLPAAAVEFGPPFAVTGAGGLRLSRSRSGAYHQMSGN